MEVREYFNINDFFNDKKKLTKKTLLAKCPFCGKETLILKNNFFSCLSCNKGGDIVSLARLNQKDKTYAEIEDSILKSKKIKKDHGIKEYLKEKKRYEELYRDAAKIFFTSYTKESIAYLKERGITQKDIRYWGIGYCNGDIKPFLDKGYTKEELEKYGFISPGADYLKFYKRITFPIMDEDGIVVGFTARTLEKNPKKTKYINSSETLLYKKQLLLYGMNYARTEAKEKGFILVEGQMDVVSLHKYGFRNTIATSGTALTEEHAYLLGRLGRDIYLCYDSDEAGQKATKRAVEILKPYNLNVYKINLSPYKDPDELLKVIGKEGFDKRLEQKEQLLKALG